MHSILFRPYLFNKQPIIYRALSKACEKQQIKEKWDLFAAILVERLPVVSKTLNPIEEKFKELLSTIEFENSLKSDHELKHERDLIHAELIKRGEMEIDFDDASSKQTAQDLKDAYVEEFKKFQVGPRTTKDDETNNLKSTNRKLEECLYLFVEQKINDKSLFVLPQGKWNEGETLRQTAERILKEVCGDSIKASFYGNSPCGFYKFKYPGSKRDDCVGAKIFFFRSSLSSGNVDEKVTPKFEWLNKDNLEKKCKGSYGENIQKFLL